MLASPAIHNLVFYEFHETMNDALTRERRIKKWRRQGKLDLIEQNNPQWRDLYQDLES
jgi:putative endonuclease